MTISLRAATPDDVEVIAGLWHQGWLDGHVGHVPDALLPHRRPIDFRNRVPPRVPDTTVAIVASGVVGFVTVHDDEVEQLFVAQSARGGGAADALLRHAEQVIAARSDVAWLAVVAGNARPALLRAQRLGRRRRIRLRGRDRGRNHSGPVSTLREARQAVGRRRGVPRLRTRPACTWPGRTSPPGGGSRTTTSACTAR